MITAEDAINIYQSLLENNIQVWLVGGWGIDALLGEQTRPHKDLDVVMLVDDVGRLCELLSHDGYEFGYLWEENLWAVDARGVKTSTAFVLQDADGRELDAHAMRLDAEGNGIPAWDAEGRILKRQDLAGEGIIAGVTVPCFTAEMQMACHTGYELPEKQVRDLELLHKKFGVAYPAELKNPL
jgi:lincosamide nucleotidyltransferase A/C/D/E